MQHQRPSSLCLSTAAPMLNGAPAHSTPCPPSPAALGAAKQAWAADRPAADPSQRWQNRASAGRRAFPGAFRCRAVSLPGRVTIFLAPHAMRTFIVFFFFFFLLGQRSPLALAGGRRCGWGYCSFPPTALSDLSLYLPLSAQLYPYLLQSRALTRNTHVAYIPHVTGFDTSSCCHCYCSIGPCIDSFRFSDWLGSDEISVDTATSTLPHTPHRCSPL